MTDEKDIYRAAKILIDRYGLDAEKHALAKLSHFMELKDVVASSMWLMLAQTIKELNTLAPNNEYTIH